MLGVGLAAGFKQYRDRHADNQYCRRQKVRKLADAGDAQANTIMNAEAARGQKRRDALFGTHAYSDKLDSERERHRLTRAGLASRRSASGGETSTTLSTRTTSSPIGCREHTCVESCGHGEPSKSSPSCSRSVVEVLAVQ